MPIIDNEFWQDTRPDGYFLSDGPSPVFLRNPDIKMQNQFKPDLSFFLKILKLGLSYEDSNGFQSSLEFVNKYGSLFSEDAENESVKKCADELQKVSTVVKQMADGKIEDKTWPIFTTMVSYISDNSEKVVDIDTKELNIEVIPKTLLAHIWLYLSYFCTGEKNFKHCAYDNCDNWFEVDVPERGKPRLYCSTSHASMASRKRKSTETS